MSVLLFSHVNWLAVELENSSKAWWSVVLFLWLLKLGEDCLKFIKYGKIGVIIEFRSINASLHYASSEVRDHEKLLDQTVHVTGASEVL